MIVVVSGGVGAARLLRALRSVHDPAEVTAVVNVGDDLEMHGLTICPDLDTITYTLADRNDDVRGWGLREESWRTMDAFEALGGDAWFRLGDLDLATHLFRTHLLQEGATKSEVTLALTAALKVPERLLPVTDDPLATRFLVGGAWLSFQEYFVRERHAVAVERLEFRGASAARPAPGVLAALANARRIVIAPSNPLISIEPILAVPGVRDAIEWRREDVVAVSPLVGGRALKGPADRLLTELGHEASAAGVARYYHRLAHRLVIDVADAHEATAVAAEGVTPIVTTTVMDDPARARALAEAVLS